MREKGDKSPRKDTEQDTCNTSYPDEPEKVVVARRALPLLKIFLLKT
ncbi:MAG TPA: hypothetical protein ACFYEF_04425 [Candidatus Wunengus sp. YC63]